TRFSLDWSSDASSSDLYRYALPDYLYTEHSVRRYGFHATSHRYVSRQASLLMDMEPGHGAWLTAHLGNGCSTCAVLDGRSLDTRSEERRGGRTGSALWC